MNPITVAMSGGGDSSVAALLLTQAGRQVLGVTMKLVAGVCTEDYPERACCSPEAINRARATCPHLGTPHYTLNLARQFERDVISD